MKFTIETLNDSGSGMKYSTKEDFLKEIALMIDDCIANGGTFFDVQVDSDASCFCDGGDATPMYDPGDEVLFATQQEDLKKYDGKRVRIARLLSENECDVDDVGFMYEVTYDDDSFHAFEDELSPTLMTVEEMMTEVKKQFAAGNANANGEPQAFVLLPNGRVVEVTLEKVGLPETQWFYSARLHCNEGENDGGLYEATVGIIDVCCTSSSDEAEIPDLLERVLELDNSTRNVLAEEAV